MKELNTKHHKTNFYETMYDYAQSADISHYAHTVIGDCIEAVLTVEFCPMSDPDLYVDYNDPTMHNGKTYLPINWGENEKSAILETAANGTCWVRYIPGNHAGTYVSDGTVYASEKAAQEGR